MSDTTDVQYADLIRRILDSGESVTTRNATCRRVFGVRLEFRSTPLVGVRRTAWKTCIREMEWVVSGSSNLKDLHPSVHAWWRPWADAHGDVLYNYGWQLRRFGNGHDQIRHLVDGIAAHPHSRRNLVTTWNPEDMTSSLCPITNCWGTVIQAFVCKWNGLHFVTYQRSVDVVCGLPHNLVQMWSLLLWLAHRTGRSVGSLVWFGGDVHVYEEHVPLARRMLKVAHVPKMPGLVYTPTSEEFRADDFSLNGEYGPLLEDRAAMVV